MKRMFLDLTFAGGSLFAVGKFAGAAPGWMKYAGAAVCATLILSSWAYQSFFGSGSGDWSSWDERRPGADRFALNLLLAAMPFVPFLGEALK